MLDPLSPIAPARVQVLILPIGRIKRARFLSFVERLQPENVVQLGDISPDGRPNRNMFSPLAFPTGRIVYDLRTTLPPESHRALSPFETFRDPLVIIGVADGYELGHISYGSSPSQQSKRDSLTPEERDLRQLYQELEYVRDQYPKSLVHQLLLFDYVHAQSAGKLPEGLVPIPSPSGSRTTTIKTVMCDVSSMLLAELTTLARSIQARSTIESPAQLQHGGDSWSSGQNGSLARRNSQFTNFSSRDSSPSTNLERSHVRMSMPAQLRSTLSESRATTIRPMTPPDGTQTPSTIFEGITASRSPEQTSPEKRGSKTTSDSISRDSSRDRVSIQGFGGGSVSERSRNKGKGRVAVVIGSLYLHAGRWGDAQRELVEGALAARANSDHLWHAKALENILASMLMLAWTGLDFQIPLVCYASTDKAAASVEQKGPASNRLVSLHNLGVLLPELLDRILNLYQRAANFAGESLPQFCFSETVIRFSKLMTPVHLAGGKIDDNVLAFIVQGVPFAQPPNIRQPRLNVHPTRTEIATMLFRAFPSFSSKEDLSVIDRTIVLGGIASVLGSLGYHRKKAMVTRELVSVLIPGLVQARKIGAAEMGVHPAAGLSALNAINGLNSGAGVLDMGEGDVADGIGEFLDILCRVYGVVGFQPYREPNTRQADKNSNNPPVYDDSDETVIARSLHNAITRSFSKQDLKMNVLRACINLCEALPDFQGVLKFTTDLLRTAGSGIAPGSRGEDAAPKMSREEQVRLATNISRTIGAGEKLGLQNLEAEYWDEFVIRGIELESLPALLAPTRHRKAEILGTSSTAESEQKNPFIYNPFIKKHDAATVDYLLVAGEHACFSINLQNPYDFEVEIESIKLDTEGVQFTAEAQATVLGPYRTQVLNISGRPESAGSVVVTGCLLKVRGCRERHFPIFNESWVPQREFKIKTIGLKYALPTLECPNSTIMNFDRIFPSVSPPNVSSLKLDVIDRQPIVVITSCSIKQSAIMVLEGERQTFSVTLQNVSKDTAVNLLMFSFQDSTQRRAQEIISNKDTSSADLYELELVLSQQQALRWVKDAEAEPFIPPGGTATFAIEVLGKPGLTNGLVQINYTYMENPAANTADFFYTRQVSLPLTMTVNASIEVVRVDILPLSTNVPVQILSGKSASLQGQEWFNSEDYCLLLLDLRNAWPICLHVQLNIQDASLVSEDILPGNISRIIVPIRRIHLQNPHAPIPALDPTRERQFIVSTSRISAETEQFSREAFWYREELLKMVQGTWETTSGSPRRGEIDLRGIKLGPRMIEALKIEDLELRICPEHLSNLQSNIAGAGFTTDQCYTFKISIHNRSPHPIYPMLRLQPSLRNQHPNASLDLTKKLVWNGTLQRTLSMLPANEVAEVKMGITALCRGEFEIGASVEEIIPSDGDGYEDYAVHGRESASTQTWMDELFRVKRRRVCTMARTKQTLVLTPSNSSRSNGIAKGEDQAPIKNYPTSATPTHISLEHVKSPAKSLKGLADPPADYLVVEQDEEWCRKNYGAQYLNYIANRHLPYCEVGSTSTMECFHDNGGSDYCLAKGVKFNAERGYHLALNCKLRNFTLERTSDPEKARLYKYVKDIGDFKDEWYGTGAGPALSSWEIESKPNEKSCTAMNNDGKYYLYIHREDGSNLWHKLMELWQAMITIDTLQMAIDPSTNLPYLAASDVTNVQVVFTDNEVDPLDDIWGLITGSPPIRVSELTSRCMGSIILPLAGSSSPFWKSHWENKDCTSRFLLDAFVRRVYKYLDIEPLQRQAIRLSGEEETVVTIIERKHNRIILHLSDYVSRLRQLFPNVTVQVIDLAQLTLREQILVMRRTDVLVGVVGAGMTHILWLDRESSVAEISPPEIDYAGFRNLAKMRQLSYFTLHGQSSGEWNATVAAAEAGELRDLAFKNEELGSKAVVDDDFKGQKGDWQSADIWLTNDEFQSLLAAAINAQNCKGSRKIDIKINKERKEYIVN